MILRSTDAKANADFMREVALLKYLSRDRNIVQFYGACIKPAASQSEHEQLCLITEFMEVSRTPFMLHFNPIIPTTTGISVRLPLKEH